MADFSTLNPYTGQKLEDYQYESDSQLESLLERSVLAQLAWRRRPLGDRAAVVLRLAQSLRENSSTLARLITLEMGKPISQSLSEIEKSALAIETFCKQQWQTADNHVHFAPLGVILGIMPWNFPVWQSIRFAIPTLLTGNTVLLKPADNTKGTSRLLQSLIDEALGDRHLLQTFSVLHSKIRSLLGDGRVRGVSLTGSTQAGRSVASACGEHVKKCVLELGGSDAYLICKDADVPRAAEICAHARLVNTGQSCVAAKRFLVDEAVFDEFCLHFFKTWVTYKLGDPLLATTRLGPLARADLRSDLVQKVDWALQNGAHWLWTNSSNPSSNREKHKLQIAGHASVEPAVLLAPTDHPIHTDEVELFGPIAVITKVHDRDEAIRLANSSPYGLGSAIFSRDLAWANRAAREELDAGLCFINDQVISSAEFPFGGVKCSGYGRELGSQGFLEFCNVKFIGPVSKKVPQATRD